MRRYTVFTKDELWDMLDGKEVVASDEDGTQHIYVSEEKCCILTLSDEDD